jgi:hypothetical protein
VAPDWGLRGKLKNGATMDRRKFIKISSASGLAVHFGSSSVALATSSHPALPRQESMTGMLTMREKALMWSIFSAIGDTWGIAEQCFLVRKAFDEILDLKTSRPPSYLGEYKNAISTLSGQDPKQALSNFLQGQPDEKLLAFVVAEFIELQLAHGGFRALGYKNYRGYMGGPFSTAENRPYRVLERK